ncbi:hypothetical protein Tco_1115922 [Tanacetum coccineum]
MLVCSGSSELWFAVYLSSPTNRIVSFLSDADWQVCPTTSEIDIRYYVFLGNNVLTCLLNVTTLAFSSSVEAEYRGVANVFCWKLVVEESLLQHQRLAYKFDIHSDFDVPEAELPRPFNRKEMTVSFPAMPVDSSNKTLPNINEAELLNPSHFPRSFKRRFSTKDVDD